MKSRPILFSAPMINAILDGSKTQTRRVMKPQPDGTWVKNPKTGLQEMVPMPGYAEGSPWWNLGGLNGGKPCPYGAPLDFLWVRETFVLENTYDYHGDHVVPTDGRPIQKQEDGDGNYWLIPHYRATEPEPNIVPYRCDADDDRTRWTPSIFMPRWASRITLEITEVRVERLQDISEVDALEEGITYNKIPNNGLDPMRARKWYQKLWESINGHGSWDLNPWVWVIEFERVLA